MIRQAWWLGVGVAIGLARGPGCGGSDEAPGAVNAPCTRDRDCLRELVCAHGVCAERDAGQDAAPAGDAGPGDAPDGG